MAPLDADIDHLYQLPLGEFTAARNALAERAGERRASVKALQKPTAAAWAVNQLHWHRRAVLGSLLKAAEHLRSAQLVVIGGGQADVAARERAHGEALRVAIDAARDLLVAAGEGTSPQVMADIRDTLQALPAAEPVGRLTRPLSPMGFDALLKMMPAEPSRPEVSRPAPVDEVSERRRQREEAGRAARVEADRADADRRRRRAELETKLRDTRTVERVRGNAVARSQEELTRATRELERRQAALDEQRAELKRLTAAVREAEHEAADATRTIATLEAELAKLGKP